MKFGKTIKIFLIDGDPNGRMTCELSNWTGKAYKIPRIMVKDCSDRTDMTNAGIYLLLGKNEEGKDIIYIGETESILKRITQQLAEKEFWNESIIFISKDDNLNKAHIKYIENRLYELAKTADRYLINNPTIPTQSSLSESEKAEMEEFIENIKLLVNTLGHKVFEERRELKPNQKQEIFYIKSARGAEAQGEQTSEGFLVFKGSRISNSTVESISPSFLKQRVDLNNKGIIKQQGEIFELTEDYIFSSPSAAASMVMGRNANGLSEWKMSDGKSLKDFESVQ
ncbi:MAG: GIY-YIG nuclease family protein [Sphingobacteriales bacterium]|nr:MAG: GIY-YIG nuclease family protein [Sphingobacteriales bacterium]